MGNTSDRVSADRHGAKAQRSDSSGSQKDQETSSKMVDSTDDPNIFNTHGTKVLQEEYRNMSYWAEILFVAQEKPFKSYQDFSE